MPDPNPTLRHVAWGEIFPWSILVRCWSLSLSPALLLVATLAVLVSPLGSWLGSRLFFIPETRRAVLTVEGAYGPALVAAEEETALVRLPRGRYRLPQSLAELGAPAWVGGAGVVGKLTRGWQSLLSPPSTINHIAYLALGGLWSLVTWALAAGTITRIAVLQLGCDRQLSLGESVRFVGARFQSYVAAPLIPLAPLILAAVVFLILGWIGQSGWGLLLVGLAWPLVLLASVVLAILFLGLAVGWPLMWVALGAESDADAFEAISRGYTYALQRPFRLIGYLAVALVVGLLGWVLVFHVSEIVLAIAASGLNPLVVVGSPADLRETGTLFRSGTWLIQLGNGLVRTVAISYGYSFFFCAAAAIYLLLRRDIDEAEFDQVVDEREEANALELPPLPADLVAATGGRESSSGSVEEATAAETPVDSDTSSTGASESGAGTRESDDTTPPGVSS